MNSAVFEVSTVFGIGMQELIIILVVALIFIGPKKLPDLAKALGKGVAQFKGAMDDVKGTFDEGIKKEVNQVKDSLLEDKSDKAQAGEGDKKEAAPADPYLAAEEKAEEKKDKPATPA
jgi:Tat protein translocase TatB subunit